MHPLYHPGIYSPCTTLGIPPVSHGEPGHGTRQHGVYRLTALRRTVAELTIGDEPLTVLSPASLLDTPDHPFHCWASSEGLSLVLPKVGNWLSNLSSVRGSNEARLVNTLRYRECAER